MSTVNLLRPNAIKFRETSADSVVYHLDGHTPTYPRTLTLTRVLPTPRKGNAGTLKIIGNVRITSDISNTDVELIVPTILKFETSVPVGSDIATLDVAPVQMIGLFFPSTLTSSDARSAREDLFVSGYLLDNVGTDSLIGSPLEGLMPMHPAN